MLHRRADALLLHAYDVAGGDRSGEEGIFAEIFEVATIHGRAINVDTGSEHEMNATGARIAADAGADALGERRIPGGGKANTPRVDGGWKFFLAAHADGPVRGLQRGNVEIRYGANGEARAANVVELLLERHFVEQSVDALIDFRA